MVTAELPLRFDFSRDHVTVINDLLHFEDVNGVRSVFLCGVLFYHYVLGNRDEEAFLIGILARTGHAKKRALARAFGVSVKSVHRYREQVEEEGAGGIPQRKRGPKGPSVATAAFRKRVVSLKHEGLSDRGIALILGVSHTLVSRILREEGYRPPPTATLIGIEEDAPCAPAPSVEEVSPVTAADEQREDESAFDAADIEAPEGTGDEPLAAADYELLDHPSRPVAEGVSPRLLERGLAATGHLVEAAPILESGTNLRFAGVFLALPGFVEVGLHSAALRVYRGLKKGFYGLTSTVLTLYLMALLRIKSPEGLAGLPPEILGRTLGLDRSPEVKTVRRKLRELSGRCRAADFVAALAEEIRDRNGHLLGFLYVDGHVRAYYGKREIPKTWVPTRRLCLPATSEIWVNDAAGDPFFFVTTEGNPSLSKALPGLLAEVKRILGERRAVVILDRGGWSVEAMKKLLALKSFDFLTYRRRPYDDLPEDLFTKVEIEAGKNVDLAENEMEISGLGKVRVVAKGDPDGKQVHILTNLPPERLSKAEVYLRITRRWRQENFFKYMRANYAIDSLVSFETEPTDGEREIPNPAWKALDRKVRAKRKEARRLTEALAEGSKEEEQGGRPTLRGSKTSVFETGPALAAAEQELAKALEARSAVPKRIQVKDLGGEPAVRLEFERKLLTDAIKICAYRAESGLANAIATHYSRSAEEGRKLIQEALHAAGDLEVTDRIVKITLEPLSSPHRTEVLEKLCESLNEEDAIYPGTKLQLRYAVRGPDWNTKRRGACQEF